MSQSSCPNLYTFNITKINQFIEKQLEIMTDAGLCTELYQNVEVAYGIELLYTPFAPKNPLSNFASKGGTIFLSKKKPLLIVADLADQRATEESLRSPDKVCSSPLILEKPAEDLEFDVDTRKKQIRHSTFVSTAHN